MAHGHISQALGSVHPVVVEQGRNAEVWDNHGQRYIDFVGGIGVLNLGHGHPAVVAAIHEQVDRLIHSAFNAVPHGGYIETAEALARFLPLDYPASCMLTNSGAEAAENALKIARSATRRSAVIAFDDGFHGRTLAALNLNGKVAPYKSGLGPLPGPVHHAPFASPDTGVTAESARAAVERIIQVEIPSDEIAAVIIEPVQGEGGFHRIDSAFAVWLREFCTRHGILLIFDEIQSGFGRTGWPMAFATLGVMPDLVLVGKSMAGGLPLAAVAGRSELMDSPVPGGLGGTYSGNPVACAAACAVMTTMTPEALAEWREKLDTHITSTFSHWHASGRYPMLSRLTGLGCMRGIEFRGTQQGDGRVHLQRLITAARQRGLLLMPSGRHRDTLRLLPPLTIEPAVLRDGLSCLEQALEDITHITA